MYALNGAELYDLIDLEFEEFMVRNAELNENGLDKMRETISTLYDREYKTLNQLYGGSNDRAGATDDDGDELPPFESAAREPRPYLQPTQQTEFGYVGLEPPLG